MDESAAWDEPVRMALAEVGLAWVIDQRRETGVVLLTEVEYQALEHAELLAYGTTDERDRYALAALDEGEGGACEPEGDERASG